MSFSSLLIHTVEISNPSDSGSSDRYGNPIDTLTSFTSPARVQTLTGEENLDDRDTRITRYRVYLPAGTNVSALSTMVVTAGGPYTGKSLRVNQEPRFRDDMHGPQHVETECEEISG